MDVDHDIGAAPIAHPPAAGKPLTGRVRPWIDWFGAGRVVATAVIVLLVVAGGWWLLRSPDPSTEAGLPQATTPASTTTAALAATDSRRRRPCSSSTSPAPCPRPGVYELPAGARVHAAIDVAGGALPEASTGSLNLAAPLTDGERVYVPARRRVRPGTATGSR